MQFLVKPMLHLSKMLGPDRLRAKCCSDTHPHCVLLPPTDVVGYRRSLPIPHAQQSASHLSGVASPSWITFPLSVVPKHECTSESPGGLVKPAARGFDWVDRGWGLKIALLSSQEIRMLLGPGPHLESHVSRQTPATVRICSRS